MIGEDRGAFSQEHFPGAPPWPPACCPSLRTHCFLPSQHCLWPCWWGMSAICSHPDGGSGEGTLSLHIAATPPHPSSRSVSLSLSHTHTHTHTHTRPHTFSYLQEELGAQGCTWGSCGQNVRKTPQMAQPCSRESSEVSGGQFPLVSHRLRLPTPLRSGPCLPLTSSLVPHTLARGPTEMSPVHTGRELQECPARELDPPFLPFLTCT